MSSMPTPCDAALPSTAASGSLWSAKMAWQSICCKACLIGYGVASWKRQPVPSRARFRNWGRIA